jgi:predicted transcriptional regulator
MQTDIPTPEQVLAALRALSYSQIQALSRLSGVSFNTLRNLRAGNGPCDPRLSTVAQFAPHLAAAAKLTKAAA